VRVPLEWLREFVEVKEPADVLAERLPAIGLGVEAVDGSGEDAVLDLEVTSNRPDCMGLLGVAREVAILFGRPLRLPPEYESTFAALRHPVRGGVRPRPADAPDRPDGAPARLAPRAGTGRDARTVFPAAWRVAIEIEDPQACPRFTASVIEDARVGPSPDWMQRRLEAAGVRAINNVVDVTNYVMLEFGQPMHAFDYSRIADRRLIVRRARRGETLETLDGVTRPLDDTMLVVADGQRAISLAGIIGGRATEIGPGTTSVLLEAAHWDPVTIARTARRLGVRTEASSRFERGTDPEGPPRAQARAARLLAEASGGRVVSSLADVYPKPIIPRVIHLRPERAVAVLGVELSREEMARSLRPLGCDVSGTRTLTVRVPTFRPDLVLEEDLIEEVIRLYGYDRVPLTLPRGETTPGDVAPVLQVDRQVREILTRCGLTEAVTLTLVTPEVADAGGGGSVRLENPLVADQAALRTSLLPGLLDVLVTNASRRTSDVQIFELGRIFRSRGVGERPEERRTIGIAVMGHWRFGWNVAEEHAVADFFHLRWILDTLLGDLGAPSWQVSPPHDPDHSWWHPGRVAEVGCEDRIVARFGELHPDLALPHRFPYRAYLAEVDLEGLLVPRQSLPELALRAEGKSKPKFERAFQSSVRPLVPVKSYAGLPRYPDVERDLAVIVPNDRPAAQIEAIIREAAAPLLETVELFDVYAGPPVPSGHRNLAYRLRLRAPDRTLTTQEAEEIIERVRITLRTRAGAQIRA
jgi:phenylalanyl-tRNA synthetase beta chain